MVPTRTEVRGWLAALASGELTREDAADAARPWIGEREVEVSDEVLWEPLSRLAGADLESGPSEYLYDVWDFETWLSEFELAADFSEDSGARSGYDAAVKVVSALLYAFDPGGMGSTVSAPEDEYDDPARRIVAQARTVADVRELARNHYPESSDQLAVAVAAALELYLSFAADERSDESDG